MGAIPGEFEAGTLGRLLGEFRDGSREAADELMEELYPELRRLAAAQMRGERADHTWQPTALVNELYLHLLQAKALNDGDPEQLRQKKLFFGLAGHMMKRMLIHHARPLYRRIEKLPLEKAAECSSGADPLHEVEDLLGALAIIEPQLRSVVEMKVFEGLQVDEIAVRLECSPRTVARHWNFAKHWLECELAPHLSQ